MLRLLERGMAVVAPPREAEADPLRADELEAERWVLCEARAPREPPDAFERCWRPPPLTGVAQNGHTVHMGSRAFLQRAHMFFSWVWQLGHST